MTPRTEAGKRLFASLVEEVRRGGVPLPTVAAIVAIEDEAENTSRLRATIVEMQAALAAWDADVRARHTNSWDGKGMCDHDGCPWPCPDELAAQKWGVK